MKKMYSFIVSMFLLFTIPVGAETRKYETDKFKEYWYAGKAEITSYELDQARYGEVHDGYAVLVFVTEDFSKKKHVKLDNPSEAGEDAVKVMKLNLIKKFNTGIYRYSIMESIFTPVKFDLYPHTLKLTMSSQEWCGHVFTQFNLNGDKYDVQSFSYFESEGDEKFSVDKTFLEDEIWTRIRLNPDNLPSGKIKIIPGLIFSRLKHRDLQVKEAQASLYTSPKSEDTMVYSLNFPLSNREFRIYFKKEFPHEIISWEEEYISGFGDDAIPRGSRAEKKKTLMIDYWNKSSLNDVGLRERLGID